MNNINLLPIVWLAQYIIIEVVSLLYKKKKWEEFDEWASKNFPVKGTMGKRKLVAVVRKQSK